MDRTLGELARLLDVELIGPADQVVSGVATLPNARRGDLTFLANPRYRQYLAATQAGVEVLSREVAPDCPRPCLVSTNPYLTYARAADLLAAGPTGNGGISPAAQIATDARLGDGVAVGAGTVISSAVLIEDGVQVGSGCVIETGAVVGKGTRLHANVTLGRNVRLGARCTVQSGAVIGSEGFGLAWDADHWHRVPQLGSVVIGDDVDIGANTCIDRGAIEDTVIGTGVKLDNLIQVAHGVRIGAHTAIAACVGISGSTTIGARCTIAGGVGFVGHITIADDVHITGMSMVTRDITLAGVYSGIPAEPNDRWRRNVAWFRRLDQLARRFGWREKQGEKASE